MRRPREVVQAWVDAFNNADADAIALLYDEDATNHQVERDPVEGRPAIHAMFKRGFADADMHCIVENLFEDGCGFFNVVDGRIHFQRGYWDRLSFLGQND